MRAFGLVVAVFLLAASPASAWQEYIYLNQNVAIQFPDKPPQVTKSTYDSVYGKALPATVYSAEDDHVIYKLTVIDLPADSAEAGSNFVNEAAYNLMREGDHTFTDFTRVYQDVRSIFGVTLVVDRTDGNRVRTSLYYHKGRLYLADAIVTPARGDKDMTTPSRFDQTIRFPPDGRFD
jgi:hypothetical protein